MFTAHLRRFLFHPDSLLLHETPGGGTGGGGQPSSGPSGAGGSGAGASQGGQPGVGGGQSGVGRSAAGTPGQGGQPGAGFGSPSGDQTFEYRDDARYRMPDGRILTGAQIRDEQRSAIDGDYRTRYQAGFETLLAEARRIDAAARQQRGGGQRQPQADPYADIRQAPIVSGDQLARVLEGLQSSGLAPIANLVRQMQAELAQTRQQFGEAQKRFGSQDEEAASRDFENRLNKTMPTLEIKGLNAKLDPSDPKAEPIRQFMRNLYLSYDVKSWRAGEFEKMASDELSSLVDAVRHLDRKVVQEGRDRLRQHFNPNRGGGAPGGQPKQKFQTPRELARMAADSGMFDNRNAT